MNINYLNYIKIMKIKPEFAIDDFRNYPLGYVIIAENKEEEQILNILRDMYFFGYIRYAGSVHSDKGVSKIMFENPRIIERCLQGILKGSVCKEHANNIICSVRGDYTPHLSPTEFKELVKSQFEIID